MISPDKLTVKAGEAFNDALDRARRAGNPLVYDLHLLLALLGQDEGIVVPMLQKIGASVAAVREQAERESARYPRQSDAQPTLSRDLAFLGAVLMGSFAWSTVRPPRAIQRTERRVPAAGRTTSQVAAG